MPEEILVYRLVPYLDIDAVRHMDRGGSVEEFSLPPGGRDRGLCLMAVIQALELGEPVA